MSNDVTDSNITTAQGTAAATAPESIIGQKTGAESSLSNWVGPYVTEMLGRGQAVSDMPYQAYTGPLSAGQSAPQTAAFQGTAKLAMPWNAAVKVRLRLLHSKALLT